MPELEQWLELMHGEKSEDNYPYEFDRIVLEILPQARSAGNLANIDNPLEILKSKVVGMVNGWLPNESYVASNVADILVLIEEAERRNISEEDIFSAIFDEIG